MMVRLGRRGGDARERFRACLPWAITGQGQMRLSRDWDQGPPSRKSPGSDPVPSRCVQMFADIRNFTQLACPDASAAYVGGFTVDYHALDGTASLNNDGNYDNAAYDTYTINTCSGAH
eukprot:CAMPEP_0180263658 /NCGR_PEP_ID=MMETSP0987-20121128/45401_1 /TAXON_ID=697907 /ORGANISM="non described non described, Strain CCMP2293" /LENGTH=117 /DNA_ID=CAMNT_0022233907 /DNA_START=315 /DNA_END=669 /DNA_ORIENTATION=+